MMRPYLTLFTASIFAGLLCASSLTAQEKPSVPARRNLAIEIVGDELGIQSPVLESAQGGMMEISPRKRLSNWKQPRGVPPLTRIRISSTYEGEFVRIKIAVVFDDSELADESVPKYGEREEALASYVAREGETVTVEGLTRFGVEPMALKVVRATPSREEPPSVIQPQITNPLQSVTVVSFEAETLQPPSNAYRLTLRNLSPKSIVALELYSAGNGGRSAQVMQGSVARPLMRPGATWDTLIRVHAEWQRTPQGLVPYARQETWQVGTLLFDDENYEGELKRAAEMLAAMKGRQAQLARALRLFQAALDAPVPEAVTLENLKSQVSTLRIDVEASLIDEIVRRFPQLASNNDRAWLKSTIMNGLKSGRQEALFHLKNLEEARTRNTENFNLQQSLSAVNQQLAGRIGDH